jgi:hypothetical protein
MMAAALRARSFKLSVERWATGARGEVVLVAFISMGYN